jgi:murein DD-endopeptidase MepM/ murein hydrolase activator NlpD
MNERPQTPVRKTARRTGHWLAIALGLVLGASVAPSIAEPLFPTGRAGELSPAGLVAGGLDAAVAPSVGAVVSAQPRTPVPPRLQISEGALGRGETLARALGDEGLSSQSIHEISRSLAPHFDFRRSQPGHEFRVARDAQGQVVWFDYLTAPNTGWRLEREAGVFEVSRKEARLVPRNARIKGLVTTTLYGAVTDLGEDGQLAYDFADVFAWDIDFQRAVRAGDAFEVLYERMYRLEANGKESYVGPGRILAARYDGAAGRHEAVYFETSHGRGGYYHPDGTSVEGQFLMSPIWQSRGRVTSPYSNARRHPILKITRPHHGIDYAAPTGTPIWAIADGTVIHRGRAGGFGNLVKIQHRNGYVSLYAHMSRFAKDLRVGQSVRQKQVIGYVGQTGLATGPHVCFRLSKDDRYVNPANLRGLATGAPVPRALMSRFESARHMLLAELDGTRRTAKAEAVR